MIGFGLGASTYLAALQRQQREEEERKRKAQYGFLMPRRYAGEDVDPEISRQARAQALIAFGLPLLGVGSTGDYGGALSQGLAGFNSAMNDTLEGDRRRRVDEDDRQYTRQQREDELLRQREKDEAYGANLDADNAREDEKIKLKAEAEANLLKYHEELLKDLDPEKRALLEPFKGKAEFDNKWYDMNKPENPAVARRDARAEAAAARSEAASARSEALFRLTISNDQQADAARAQSVWDAQYRDTRDRLRNVKRIARTNRVGQMDFNNPAAGPVAPPTEVELMQMDAAADKEARAQVEGRLGARPSGTLLPPPGASDTDEVASMLGRELSASDKAEVSEALLEFSPEVVAAKMAARSKNQLLSTQPATPADDSIVQLRRRVADINAGRQPAPPKAPPGTPPTRTIADQTPTKAVAQIEARIHRTLSPTERAMVIEAMKQPGMTVDAIVKWWL